MRVLLLAILMLAGTGLPVHAQPLSFDDIVVVALALRYAARRVPPAVLEEAWTGEQRILDRLLGKRDAGDA